MRKSLIDTDILSETRKGKNPKINAKSITYRAIWQHYTISVITVSEIIKGWRKINRNDRIQQFLADLSQVEILHLDQSCAEISGLIQADLEKAGQPIGLADVLTLFYHFRKRIICDAYSIRLLPKILISAILLENKRSNADSIYS